ncbi:MAG: hypothetical protein PSX80_14265 [bacterium]|nr:hypothetical protein [bacterium]
MYVRAGKYMINTENVTHLELEDDGGMVVYFIGGQMVQLDAESSTVVYTSLNTAFSTRPTPRPTSIS